MKKLLFLVILFYFSLLSANGQATYWQQQVNYKIDVTLNDIENKLEGFVKMEYENNSPDTLYFLWIHIWPNAYKNDRTAFSDQLLQNGRTDFYFSNADKRGYINRLNFKVDGITAEMEDHPQHQDIIKIIPATPIAPGYKVKIETPLHVTLPYNFSRGGHVKRTYQITQWYPKPAVYDRKGWHEMPYLDQGEFYSEFGNYEVQITLPQNYIVASTGELLSKIENDPTTPNIISSIDTVLPKVVETKQKSTSKSTSPAPKKKTTISKPAIVKTKPKTITMLATKTLVYKQDNVHDFAWFADAAFVEKEDTLQLPSGRIIKVKSYNLPANNDIWKNSTDYIKKTIQTRSKWLGEYPYNIASIVETKLAFNGGMEYPTITSIATVDSKETLEELVEHEVGHNWNYGILASNEREHPWMDEGINSYYDKRYKEYFQVTPNIVKTKSNFWQQRMPDDAELMFLKTVTTLKRDQPIETSADKFSEINNLLIPYTKTAEWLQIIESRLGTTLFDSCMQEFYNRWKFKHPYPEDLKTTMEDVSRKNLDSIFTMLHLKGYIESYKTYDTDNLKTSKKLKIKSFFSFKDTDKYNYLFLAPAIGYNLYDKFMLGAVVHNYTLPPSNLQYILAPLYATGSKQFNGIGRVSYTIYPGNNGQKAEIALGAAMFTGGAFTDSTGKDTYLRFSKIVPSLKFVFANKSPRSTITKYVQWKTFFIKEQGYLFGRDSTVLPDTVIYKDRITFPSANRYINQLKFVFENNRALYPYIGELQIEQGKDFARLALTGNYYFNYAKEGGMNVRLFAGKFFYLKDKTTSLQGATDVYHLNMSGPKGYEDYTYSNYFYGRAEFEGAANRQIMMRDGAFKVKTDFLSNKIGKTDNWLAAINLTSNIPKSINPLQIIFTPLNVPDKIYSYFKAFLDIGTYAEAWDKKANTGTGKLVYDAGIQISLFKNTVNIYAPFLYSKVYRDYFKSYTPGKKFLNNITFSIDIQNVRFKRLIPQLATL